MHSINHGVIAHTLTTADRSRGGKAFWDNITAERRRLFIQRAAAARLRARLKRMGTDERMLAVFELGKAYASGWRPNLHWPTVFNDLRDLI